MKVIFLDHLKLQAKERRIDLGLTEDTLLKPEQIVSNVRDLKVAQKKYFDKKKNKEYLIRVIFREEKGTRFGITVYKTSKIKKYWKQNENKI